MTLTLDGTVRLLRQADAPAAAGLTFPSFRHLLARPGDPSVVAVGAFHGCRPVGLALGVQPSGAPAHLASLFVAKEHRGRGLGQALLAAAEEELARRGSRCLRLEYHTGMPAH